MSAPPSWMALVVVDASALLEVLLATSRASRVAAAVGQDTMAAPDLIDAEVLAVLRRQVARCEISHARAGQAVEDLISAPIARLATIGLTRQVWLLRDNFSSYDTCYVALARELGCRLVTADGRLGRASPPGVPIVVV